jgi:hypothetical protein
LPEHFVQFDEFIVCHYIINYFLNYSSHRTFSWFVLIFLSKNFCVLTLSCSLCNLLLCFLIFFSLFLLIMTFFSICS